MINLIGPKRKKYFLAARRNSIWVRYNFLILAVIVAINIILAASLYINSIDQQGFDAQIKDVKQKQDKKYTEAVLKKATDFRDNISTAAVLLESNTSYSDMITTIANSIPSNCSIETLTVDTNTYKNGSQKMIFICNRDFDKVNQEFTSDYEMSKQLLNTLEKSLVFHSVYIERTETPKDKPNTIKIETSLKTQNPAINIPRAIPTNCSLRTIHTLGETPLNPLDNTSRKYFSLVCRVQYQPKDASTSQTDLEIKLRSEFSKKVSETIDQSCYFSGLRNLNEDFKFYGDDYFVANYNYGFSNITLREEPVIKKGMFAGCKEVQT